MSKMKSHSKKVSSSKHKDSPNLDVWDQSDLEDADEKDLQKRLELLRRELLNTDKKSEHHSRSKHHARPKPGHDKKKRKHSSSSSNSRSSSSSSSSDSSGSSSSSSSSSDHGHNRHKHKRHSSSSSDSPKKPKAFQKYNRNKNTSPDKKFMKHNPKGFPVKSSHNKGSPANKFRHRSPVQKRIQSPNKHNRNLNRGKDKIRRIIDNKRDGKSHSPRRIHDKRNSSPKRLRTPPHRNDKLNRNNDMRNRNNRMMNNQQRKSPPLRRNMDRNDDRGGGGMYKNNMKGRFNMNNKLDNNQFDKRNDDRRRMLKDPDDKDKRMINDKRGDKKREMMERRDNRDMNKMNRDRDGRLPHKQFKENDRFNKGNNRQQMGENSQQNRNNQRGGDSNNRRIPIQNRPHLSTRTPAQGRILDRILERRSYLGERNLIDKDKGPRDRIPEHIRTEHIEFDRDGREITRFPQDDRSSPVMRGAHSSYSDERHGWNKRASSYEEPDGEWTRKYGGTSPTSNAWDRNVRRPLDWDRKKDMQPPGSPTDSIESKRLYQNREHRGRPQSAEELEEVLSDISDDPDEILNRDDEEAHSSSDDQDYKMSAVICGPMQDPLTQRLLADDFDLDFEDPSDEDVENSNKATISDALGVDWASLVEDTKPKVKTENIEKGSAKRRWEPDQIFTRLGVSEAFAGKTTVDTLKEKYGLKMKKEEFGETPDLDSAPVLLHPVPGIHVALKEKLKSRKELFDPSRRGLSARHDLSIRKCFSLFPANLIQQAQQQTIISA